MSKPPQTLVLDEALTRQVAHLARLELTDAEVRLFTTQLAKIFEHVAQLSELDLTGVAELRRPRELATPTREDVARPFAVGPSGKTNKIVASAPETVGGGFKVPQIL